MGIGMHDQARVISRARAKTRGRRLGDCAPDNEMPEALVPGSGSGPAKCVDGPLELK